MKRNYHTNIQKGILTLKNLDFFSLVKKNRNSKKSKKSKNRKSNKSKNLIFGPQLDFLYMFQNVTK